MLQIYKQCLDVRERKRRLPENIHHMVETHLGLNHGPVAPHMQMKKGNVQLTASQQQRKRLRWPHRPELQASFPFPATAETWMLLRPPSAHQKDADDWSCQTA